MTGAVARLKETVNTETIRRVDADRTIMLSIIPPRQIPLEEGVRKVREEVIEGMPGSGELPEGIRLTISGASDRLDATRKALSGNFAVALLSLVLGVGKRIGRCGMRVREASGSSSSG